MGLIFRCLAWARDVVTSRAQKVLLKIIASGPVPKHIAFVMDGNRRYAHEKRKLIHQGHTDGFAALRKMLEICYQLNIRCVTAYAFSIENFKRNPEEVNALLRLAEEKLLELSRNGDLLSEYGVQLKIIGRKELLPESLQLMIQRVEEMTRHNDRAILNLSMPYTSRDEITTAVEKTIQEAIHEDTIDEITEKTIEANLMTTLGGSPPLDILIRTSGVQRLSDYMLWQCCENTQIRFSSTYWPNFGLWDFIPVLLDYQRKVWAQGRPH